MSFSYSFAPTLVNLVRLLIADTQDTGHVFEDEEITNAGFIQQQQFSSGMFYSGAGGAALPYAPVSYLRVAALLLDALASNKARLANALQVLDVKVNTQSAAQELRAQASAYRETDNDTAFAIIEQCQTQDSFSFADRYWKSVQRQSAQ